MNLNKQEKIIYLLRHGSVLQADEERHYIGETELPLSTEGVEQAHLLHSEFSGKEISAVICSDLIRSVDTAGIVCRGLTDNIIVRSDLREISMGEWEGKSFCEIAQKYPEEYQKRGENISTYRIPGAESFRECQSRVIRAFSDIIESIKGNVLIVGHAGVNRLLLCYILGMPIENIFRISQDYACINIVVRNQNEYRVVLLNGSCCREKDNS
jgi:alpha-ribazole phosphatase